MDVQSAKSIATMAEIVVVSNSNGIKRKRRSSIDEIENQRPPSKKVYSPSADVLDYEVESNFENGAVELDLYTLGASPQSVSLLNKIDGTHLPRNNSTSRLITTSKNNNTNNNNNINSSNMNITTIYNNNNINNMTNGQNTATTPVITIAGAVDVAEMTPQSLKASEPWNSCAKCCSKQSSESRLCPLPSLSWANAKEVWRFMCDKDKRTTLDRNSKMLQNHHGLQPRMRAILLDWLNEVCEVYKLHRETYYLALDYLDRYLSTNVSIPKSYLQLIGITCLFIAAKVEEIYPPKLTEFAYVTDGACTEENILKQELVILMALKWQISPVTIIGWLGIYMQLNVNKRTPKTMESRSQKSVSMSTTNSNVTQTDQKSTSSVGTTDDDEGFVFPQFSGLEYAQTAQLIDLCTLDVGIANFSYSVIAAAAISHTFSKKIAIKLSGWDWATISPCSRWMEPHFRICMQSPKLCLLEKNEQIHSRNGLAQICPNVLSDDSYIIQTHTTNMDMFDKATHYREQCLQEASPAQPRTNIEHICPPEGLLTPPASSRKFIEAHPDSTCK